MLMNGLARKRAAAAPPFRYIPHVRTAILVATYDQPRWLDLALRGWSRQPRRPDTVVVADDGSRPAPAGTAPRRAEPAPYAVEGRQLLGVPLRRPAGQRIRRAVRLGIRGQGAGRAAGPRRGTRLVDPLLRARLPPLARAAVRGRAG